VCMISINQQAYIDAMVNKFRLTNTKHVTTLMEPARCTVLKGTGMFHGHTGDAHVRRTLRGSNWVCPMAGYDNTTGLHVCRGDTIPVYTKSGDCPLGSPKTSHCLPWVDKRSLAYLWWMKIEGFCHTDYANQRDRHSISGYSYHFGVGAVS
jgi:hypothetical protein